MNAEQITRIELAAAGKTLTDVSGNEGENHFFECETGSCAFNHDGECRFYAVHENYPVITEEDGCLSGFLELGSL